MCKRPKWPITCVSDQTKAPGEQHRQRFVPEHITFSGAHHDFAETRNSTHQGPRSDAPFPLNKAGFLFVDRQLSALGAARPLPRIPARSPVRSDCVEKVEFEVVVVAGTSEERTRMPGSPAQAAQVSAGAGIGLANL